MYYEVCVSVYYEVCVSVYYEVCVCVCIMECECVCWSLMEAAGVVCVVSGLNRVCQSGGHD